MLTAQEEKELLESLPLSKLCTEEQELLRFLFENKLKKYNKPSETVLPESVDGLQENLDMTVSLTERHYYNCDFKMCYKPEGWMAQLAKHPTRIPFRSLSQCCEMEPQAGLDLRTPRS